MQDIQNRFRPLAESGAEPLRDFDCGDAEMNEWLWQRAFHEQENRLNRTYLIAGDNAAICPGFVSLSAAQVAREQSELRRSELPYPVAPAILIGRLAVHTEYQGRGLAKALIRFARLVAFEAPIGCRFLALHVDVDNQAAVNLYNGQGFRQPPGAEPDRGSS